MIKNCLEVFPGIAVSVVINDQIIYSKVVGNIGRTPGQLSKAAEESSDISQDISLWERRRVMRQLMENLDKTLEPFPPQVDENTVFLLASITKTFIAVLCLQCFERGELDLDTDINEYLSRDSRYPPVPRVDNPYFSSHAITLRHLLTHSSGLSDDESALESDSKWRVDGQDCPITLREYVTRRLIPNLEEGSNHIWSRFSPPGAKDSYHYSNAGFTLIGLVLEQATGMDLNTLANRDIFSPLGMQHTSFSLNDLLSGQSVLALPHRSRLESIPHFCVAEWPACQIRSSLSDLTKYLLTFTSESPTIQLVSNASLAQVFPQNKMGGLAWWGKDAAYGNKEGKYFSHGGFMDGVRTHIYLWPESSVESSSNQSSMKHYRKGAIILTNGTGSYECIIQAIEEGLACIP